VGASVSGLQVKEGLIARYIGYVQKRKRKLVHRKQEIHQIKILKFLITMAGSPLNDKHITSIHPEVTLFCKVNACAAQDNNQFRKIVAVKGIGNLGRAADEFDRFVV